MLVEEREVIVVVAPDIASSSAAFYYVSLEQQSFITLPLIRMAARAIYMTNYPHLHPRPHTDG